MNSDAAICCRGRAMACKRDMGLSASLMQPSAASACKASRGLRTALRSCTIDSEPAFGSPSSRPKAPLARSLLAAAMPLQALAHAYCGWAPTAATSSGRPAAPAALLPRLPDRRRQRRQIAAAAGAGSGQPHPEESEGPQGDSKLQDSLVNQLQFEIGKKRVRAVTSRWCSARACCAAALPPAALERPTSGLHSSWGSLQCDWDAAHMGTRCRLCLPPAPLLPSAPAAPLSKPLTPLRTAVPSTAGGRICGSGSRGPESES